MRTVLYRRSSVTVAVCSILVASGYGHAEAPRLVLSVRPGGIRDVAISDDGRWLATLREEVDLWDGRSGRHLCTIPLSQRLGECSRLAFCPQGRLLAVGLRGAVLISAELPEEVVELPWSPAPASREGGALDLVISAHGRIAAACFTGGWLRVWDLDGSRLVLATEVATQPWDLAVSGDGSMLGAFCWNQQGQRLTVWDLESGSERGSLQLPDVGPDLLCFTRDGQALVHSQYDHDRRDWWLQSWHYREGRVERLASGVFGGVLRCEGRRPCSSGWRFDPNGASLT